MNNISPNILKLKENLEHIAFLVSKGGAEREAHAKTVESLVILSQLENMIHRLTPNTFSEVTRKFIPSSQDTTKDLHSQEEKIHQEIIKVNRRLSGWFKKTNQKNSIILLNFLKLREEHQYINLQMLRDSCSSINDFDGNYHQMKNFGEKNHGKVFEEINGNIILWEPVKEYILNLYKNNIN